MSAFCMPGTILGQLPQSLAHREGPPVFQSHSQAWGSNRKPREQEDSEPALCSRQPTLKRADLAPLLGLVRPLSGRPGQSASAPMQATPT